MFLKEKKKRKPRLDKVGRENYLGLWREMERLMVEKGFVSGEDLVEMYPGEVERQEFLEEIYFDNEEKIGCEAKNIFLKITVMRDIYQV